MPYKSYDIHCLLMQEGIPAKQVEQMYNQMVERYPRPETVKQAHRILAQCVKEWKALHAG